MKIEMENLLGIKEAAEYVHVTTQTLRIWDNNGKLKSIKTPGGHRRYRKEDLDEFLGVNNKPSYGKLYEALCEAQYIADELKDEFAGEILNIRVKIGDKLLDEHSKNFAASKK